MKVGWGWRAEVYIDIGCHERVAASVLNVAKSSPSIRFPLGKARTL
jgi:hypothetical protein